MIFKKKLKIRIEKNKNESWEKLISLDKYLNDKNIILNEKEPDLILYENTENINPDLPFIFCIRKSSGCSVRLDKKILESPNFKGVIKNRVYRNYSINYSYLINDNYHYYFINEDYKKLRNCFYYKEFEEYVYEKVNDRNNNKFIFIDSNLLKCAIWDFHFSFMNDNCRILKENIIDFNKKRSIDVFCSLRYGDNPVVEWHRRLALYKINQIKGIKIKAGNLISIDEEYNMDLLNTKICISPWGAGEYCIRDFETILAGAILIKPDTSFVYSYPDIYKNNEYYIPCKSDYSDLEDIVFEVLNNYKKYNDMRVKARNFILKHWSEKKVIKILCDTIKSLYYS